MITEPTIDELIKAGTDAIRSRQDLDADGRRGSVYEYLMGAAAIIWSRETQRDTDLVASAKFSSASGDDLTRMGAIRYKIERILDTPGAGFVSLTRASATGGSGTFWRGTRFEIGSSSGLPQYYEVSQDTVVTGISATVPIQSVKKGTGTKVDVTTAHLVDPVYDVSWRPIRLYCEDGTDFEEAKVYRQRIRQTRFDSRVGEEQVIIDACKAAGADKVALFRSNYAGNANDFGLNWCYVADAGYSSTPELVRACRFAVESVRGMGDCLQVLPMRPSAMHVEVNVTMADHEFHEATIAHSIADLLSQYVSSDGAFGYRLNAMAGNVYRALGKVQNVSFVTPNTDASVISTVGGLPNFPATLVRHFLTPNNVIVNFRYDT